MYRVKGYRILHGFDSISLSNAVTISRTQSARSLVTATYSHVHACSPKKASTVHFVPLRLESSEAQTSSQQSPKPSGNGGSLLLKAVAAVGLLGGVAVGVCWYSSDTRTMVEHSVPYSKELLGVLLGDLSPPALDTVASVTSSKGSSPVIFSESSKDSFLPPAAAIPTPQNSTTKPPVTSASPSSPSSTSPTALTSDEKARVKEAAARSLEEEEAKRAALNAELKKRVSLAVGRLTDDGAEVLSLLTQAKAAIRGHVAALERAMVSLDDEEERNENNSSLSAPKLDKDEQWRQAVAAADYKKSYCDKALTAVAHFHREVESLRQDVNGRLSDTSDDVAEIARRSLNILNELQHDVTSEALGIKESLGSSSIMEDLKRKGESFKAQLQQEMESIIPQVYPGKKGEKLDSEEKDGLLAYAMKRNKQLRGELLAREVLERDRLVASLDEQREKMEDVHRERINLERVYMENKHRGELKEREVELTKSHEMELRKELARQIITHSSHLEEVLGAERERLGKVYSIKLRKRLTAEKEKGIKNLASTLNKIVTIEATLDARESLDMRCRHIQQLWLASVTLLRAVTEGSASGDAADFVPLQAEFSAIASAASHDGEALVKSVVSSVHSDALERGVWTADELRDAFPHTLRACRRVARVGPDGASIPTRFLSFIQSAFVVTSASAASAMAWRGSSVAGGQGDDLAIDLENADVYKTLAAARNFVDAGNIEQAVRVLGLLQGEARLIATDWVREATLYLEVTQAAEVVNSFATVRGLGTIF